MMEGGGERLRARARAVAINDLGNDLTTFEGELYYVRQCRYKQACTENTRQIQRCGHQPPRVDSPRGGTGLSHEPFFLGSVLHHAQEHPEWGAPQGIQSTSRLGQGGRARTPRAVDGGHLRVRFQGLRDVPHRNQPSGRKSHLQLHEGQRSHGQGSQAKGCTQAKARTNP